MESCRARHRISGPDRRESVSLPGDLPSFDKDDSDSHRSLVTYVGDDGGDVVEKIKRRCANRG